MAEARRQHDTEGERRDLRGARSRNQATDQPERTKREHLHHSQGPLSSLRAAIKRTRSNSQCEHYRDRRRPEITIVSAEPLGSNSWYSGPSVVFPSLPQPSWSSHVQTVSQPPPSYDQVIQEKTQEKPTAAPRQTAVISTSATQTDPERGSTVPQSAAGKKPQKPPRPSLPRPADTETASPTVSPPDQTVRTDTTSGSSVTPEQPRRADPVPTCSRSVTVRWDFPVNHLSAPETTPSSLHSEPQPRPVPLPRRKYQKHAIVEEVRVQSLVSLSEGCDPVHPDPEDESSNKYLKELLEVFSADNTSEERRDVVDQSEEACRSEDAVGEMNTSSHRNIQARIQAFESQACTEEENAVEPVRPEPRPRKATVKPPVAAKPPVALKPPFNQSADDDSQNVTYINVGNHTPAARPQPPRKPVGMSIKEELETLHRKGAVPQRSRPPGLTRANSVYEEEPSPLPPVPPVKPPKEPLKPNLNINNHNSASVFNENEYENALAHHMPVEPERNVDTNGASFPRQSVTRRPTTIRVPSRAVSFSDHHHQDTAPPLPVQKPVGSLKTSAPLRQSSMPVLPPQFGPEPSLPPRRQSTTKTLPPRPPPAKPGPGRPPPPSLQATGQSVSLPWEVSPKPQKQTSHRKRPVLPPRPSPGHRLYNKYTLELPHGIAALDYKGSSTGELSFQKNEVLLLVEEIDQNMFECQIGDLKGRVHKSRMKVITPLASDMSATQGPGPSASDGGSGGQRMQVIYDFNPEGPGELGLKAGDIVTMVEPVDSEWCRGTCRGSTGFFPVNYVKVLSDSTKPLPERKPKPPSAAVGGPRCKARFDFEGEHSDELSFTEGDVIKLKEYCGQDWARGQLGAISGIFPLNFVEIIEDLPPPPGPQQPQPKSVALPGMVPSSTAKNEFAKPSKVSQSSVDWAVARYDYAGKSDDDLSFQEGDRILVTQRLNAEWSRGRLNGREGMFPTAFVESGTGQQSSTLQQNAAAPSVDRGRALYDFTSDCDEELSLQFGDIITNLESLDEEWFMGDLRGKRALVPKNYLQVL
uniref:SH3 domain-containing protein 19 isoform X2 n=1 Tax=Solea senegalensis TaxID=28829 RepID=UPI001CD86D9D|nr:SH3 domain-containing protein 19 isoform X2 [Solea senegalensis]